MGRNRLILLDTCALLWLASDPSKISPEVLQRIDDSPVVYISAVSAFEIGLKYKSGKLILPVRPETWFEEIVNHHSISLIDLDASLCLKAAELPPIHKDPCDRFIIATGLDHGLTIVTADSRFADYGVQVII